MVNLVFVNGDGHKEARPVLNRKEYIALRNAPENAKNFYDARGGNEAAKAQQIQFCYNDLLPDGVLKGFRRRRSPTTLTAATNGNRQLSRTNCCGKRTR